MRNAVSSYWCEVAGWRWNESSLGEKPLRVLQEIIRPAAARTISASSSTLNLHSLVLFFFAFSVYFFLFVVLFWGFYFLWFGLSITRNGRVGEFSWKEVERPVCDSQPSQGHKPHTVPSGCFSWLEKRKKRKERIKKKTWWWARLAFISRWFYVPCHVRESQGMTSLCVYIFFFFFSLFVFVSLSYTSIRISSFKKYINKRKMY